MKLKNGENRNIQFEIIMRPETELYHHNKDVNSELSSQYARHKSVTVRCC